jgi:hypothetical protein
VVSSISRVISVESDNFFRMAVGHEMLWLHMDVYSLRRLIKYLRDGICLNLVGAGEH